MRIAICTPWNRHSAIAGDNLLAARELRRRGVTVAILRSETGEAANAPALSQEFPVLAAGHAIPSWLAVEFDCVCYAIGNYYPFHAEAIRLMAPHPGVALIHDLCLTGLFYDWSQQAGPEQAAAVRQALYGAPLPDDAGLDWQVENQPMVEWPARMASGAVVHAAHYFERVRRVCRGPVAIAPVPAFGPALPGPPPGRRPGARMTVATLGHVNPNKLSDEIITAIGESERLRDNVVYRLVGPADPSQQAGLTQRAQALGVRVEFTGWLTEAAFGERMRDVDVVTCLRRPVTEGASGTAIHALRAGYAVLVNDVGFYAECPDDAVIKLSADAQPDAIRAALELLFDHPERAVRCGERARQWAAGRFSASSYVDVVLPLIERVAAATNLRPALNRSVHLFRTMGFGPEDAAFIGLVDQARGLFGPAADPALPLERACQ